MKIVLLHVLLVFFISATDGFNMNTSCSFQGISNVAAGDPSELWSDSLRRANRPLPTNTFWLNYVLEDGSQPEYIHPYSVKSARGYISVCYPSRQIQQTSVIQVHADDVTISCKEESGKSFVVSSYEDLSVTLASPGGRVWVPLVRGSPYVTFIFQRGTPVFTTIHVVVNSSSNSDSTKHRLVMNNGQIWLIYASSPLSFSGGSFDTQAPYTGVIRVALLSNATSEHYLDKFSSCYPVGGQVEYSPPSEIRYIYRTNGSCSNQLLMLGLPMHRALMKSNLYYDASAVQGVSYRSIDGQMEGIVGNKWTLRVPTANVSWYSQHGIRSMSCVQEIGSALEQDSEALPAKIQNSSPYFFGKEVARAARLALIAQEVGRYDLLENITTTLKTSLKPWLTGDTSVGNGIGYDRKWGGLVSQGGAADSGADFGNGIYNDHHFHWGYFVYSGAVLAKLDWDWGSKYRCKLYELMSDYMQLQDGTRFPRLRHFDPWVMHSWAAGLKKFADGRNQESTSEAVNAYYSASLLGTVYEDDKVRSMGLLLAGVEVYGAQFLWHVPEESELYEDEFVKDNRMVGVLWSNKRDAALWFAPAEQYAIRVGIQVLPVTPVTEMLFPDLNFNKEAVEWSMEKGNASDSWKGFICALQATYDRVAALGLFRQLNGFDDGNSASNLLWWIHTRPLSFH